MESDQNQESWKRLAHWYSQASEGQAPPSQELMDSIATKRKEIYKCRPPEGIQFPIMLTPAAVEDNIPGEE